MRKRLEGGYKHSALDYLNAMAKREAVRAAFAQTFTEVDVIVGATLPALPPRVDEDFVHIDGKEENTVEAFTRFNAPQNLAGLPAHQRAVRPRQGTSHRAAVLRCRRRR